MPAWLVGNALRIRQLRADLFETRARQLEQQQEQARQAAILEERGRYANVRGKLPAGIELRAADASST